MQSDQQFCPNKAGLPPGNQMFDTYMHAPVPSSLNAVFPPGVKHLAPFHGFEFHPSEVCPKNFIIFDQTDNRSQIMFHPGIAHKFSAPSFNFHATCIQGNTERNETNNEDRESSSYPLEEDSDDINALLSSEDEEQDEYEYDEEEVSTARTHGNNGNMSPDSFSNYVSKPSNNMASSSSQKSSSSSSYDNESKRRKMRKMVKALRGIVPGGDQMNNTVTVIDEAVRYLKSLKVEVQKLGVGNLRD